MSKHLIFQKFTFRTLNHNAHFWRSVFHINFLKPPSTCFWLFKLERQEYRKNLSAGRSRKGKDELKMVKLRGGNNPSYYMCSHLTLLFFHIKIIFVSIEVPQYYFGLKMKRNIELVGSRVNLREIKIEENQLSLGTYYLCSFYLFIHIEGLI